MKFSKKLIVSSMASAMALSLVGTLTGTFAWYQFSTRATASLIGMNVAQTGVLEISATSATDGFKKDLISADILAQVSADDSRTDFKITPVTFAAASNMTATSALPATAYKNPDVSNRIVNSDGSDYENRGKYAYAWDEADASTDYIQFDLWVRAREADNVSGGFTQVAKDVYVTDFILANIGAGLVLDGLRVHIAIDADNNGSFEANHLYSKTAKNNLKLYGYLDQDNDGIADRVGGYEWATHRSDHIVYGEGTNTQTTATLDSQKATRDSDGNITGQGSKKLFTTPLLNASHLVVTIWMEGWEISTNLQKTGVERYEYEAFATEAGVTDVTGKYYQYRLNDANVANNYYLVDAAHSASGKAVAGYSYFTRTTVDPTETVADWSGYNTDGAGFQFGLTFDVGRNAFEN